MRKSHPAIGHRRAFCLPLHDRLKKLLRLSQFAALAASRCDNFPDGVAGRAAAAVRERRVSGRAGHRARDEIMGKN